MRDRTVERPASDVTARPSLVHRWGAAMARHRRVVLAVWLVGLVCCALAYPVLQGRLRAPDYGVNDAESTRASRLIERHFGARGAEQDVIVFHAARGDVSDPTYRDVVGRVVAAARHSRGVAGVVGPFDDDARDQVSADRHTAIAVVGLSGDSGERADHAKTLQSEVRAAAGHGVHAWLTGYSPVANDLGDVESADSERAESIGISVALVVLVLALGAVVAAAMPVLLAGAGLVLTFGAMTALSYVYHFDSFLVVIASMIGLGIGIDYALFIVARFREELAGRGVTDRRDRAGTAEAVGAAMATSGRTVVISGVIVMISLCSLFLVNAPSFREIAVGVLVVVTCTLLAAFTLLPAVLAMLGPWINRGALPARLQPADARTGVQGRWGRWARAVMRRPVAAGVLVVVALAVATVPITGLRYGVDLGTASLGEKPSGRAQAVLTRSFGPGLLSPVQLVVTADGDGPLDARGTARAKKLAGTLSRDPRVERVIPVAGDGRMLLSVVPAVAVDSTAANELVRHVRDDVAPRLAAHDGPEVVVGGATAEFVDLSDETRQKFPLVVLVVLGLSFLFLLVAFRSLALPLKAVVMNLLATGAAIGLTVVVFQWGHGASLLGFESPGFLQVYLPISVFALLFGLSMDYEVFLIRRMRESWESTHDNETAVATGIDHTARPIAAAAAIMVAVFGSFLVADVLELKEIGFALAVAIALDATLVRLVLVPALMRLLGNWNWWLPGPLERRLPRIRLD